MKPRIYLETTIPSYLTAWPSRDLVRAAHQQITREWWQRRHGYEPFISQLVVRECQAGDPIAAAARLEALEGLSLLAESEEAESLARDLLDRVPLPDRAAADALHIATAAVHGMDYLLTRNCTHIANAALRGRIEVVCRDAGFDRRRSARRKSCLGVKTMNEDDVVREVRAARDEYCRQFGYDLVAIVRELREQERVGGRRVVHLSPRRPVRVGRKTAGEPA